MSNGTLTAPKRFSIDQIKRTGSGLPSRVIVYGQSGVGKTSFAAHAPKPVFLQSKGETGLETLIDSGQLPEVDHFPEVQSFEEALGVVDLLINEEHDYRTCVIDTINGIERLCHEHVCRTEYGGEWGEKGFTSYQRGYETSLGSWRQFLDRLDRLRERKVAVLCLAHTKVSTFKNPSGADYDKYAADMHHKTWSLTHGWADMVLFAQFESVVVTDKGNAKKGKVEGGTNRVLRTTQEASYDAKHRHGLPEIIEMGNCGAEAWANFQQAITEGRKTK